MVILDINAPSHGSLCMLCCARPPGWPEGYGMDSVTV